MSVCDGVCAYVALDIVTVGFRIKCKQADLDSASILYCIDDSE